MTDHTDHTDHTETLIYLLRNLRGLNTGVGTIAACVAAIEDALGLNHDNYPDSSQMEDQND